jgi:hypothetical protein
VEEPERARRVAIVAVEADLDLVGFLPLLRRVTSDHAAIRAAADGINRDLVADETNVVLRRARALLVGALHATLHRPTHRSQR